MTSTDVATARAQLAEAITKAVESQGQLELARATFLKLIGKYPGDLELPTFLLPLPETLDRAIETALAEHPF